MTKLEKFYIENRTMLLKRVHHRSGGAYTLKMYYKNLSVEH